MSIELSDEIEAGLQEAARLQGLTVGQYIESLVRETNLRRHQVAEFQAVLAERLASLDAGNTVDGEEVMSRLIAELATK